MSDSEISQKKIRDFSLVSLAQNDKKMDCHDLTSSNLAMTEIFRYAQYDKINADSAIRTKIAESTLFSPFCLLDSAIRRILIRGICKRSKATIEVMAVIYKKRSRESIFE